MKERRRPAITGPARLLLPVAIGLGLLAWALELGRPRPRATSGGQPGGPLVEVPEGGAGGRP